MTIDHKYNLNAGAYLIDDDVLNIIRDFYVKINHKVVSNPVLHQLTIL